MYIHFYTPSFILICTISSFITHVYINYCDERLSTKNIFTRCFLLTISNHSNLRPQLLGGIHPTSCTYIFALFLYICIPHVSATASTVSCVGRCDLLNYTSCVHTLAVLAVFHIWNQLQVLHAVLGCFPSQTSYKYCLLYWTVFHLSNKLQVWPTVLRRFPSHKQFTSIAYCIGLFSISNKLQVLHTVLDCFPSLKQVTSMTYCIAPFSISQTSYKYCLLYWSVFHIWNKLQVLSIAECELCNFCVHFDM